MFRTMMILMALGLAACGEQVTPIELSHRVEAACRKALPESRPTPTWRPCSRAAWCFYCADDTGRLVPVRMPCTETGKVSLDDGRLPRAKMCDQGQD